MTKKTQLDHLERLVSLISDDNELLSRANDFMQHLVSTKLDYRGQHDLAEQLMIIDMRQEDRHQ